MNLKLNKNKKAVYKYLEKEYLIVDAKIIGYFIDIVSECGKKFTIVHNKKNLEILNESIEVFL